MKNKSVRNCVHPQISTPFDPPSKDPYEPILSDESTELGLKIEMVSNPENNPNMKTQPKTVPLLQERENGPLTKAKKPKPLVNVLMYEQQKANSCNQRIVYNIFRERDLD